MFESREHYQEGLQQCRLVSESLLLLQRADLLQFGLQVANLARTNIINSTNINSSKRSLIGKFKKNLTQALKGGEQLFFITRLGLHSPCHAVARTEASFQLRNIVLML